MDKVKLIDETIQVLTINKDKDGKEIKSFEKGILILVIFSSFPSCRPLRGHED